MYKDMPEQLGPPLTFSQSRNVQHSILLEVLQNLRESTAVQLYCTSRYLLVLVLVVLPYGTVHVQLLYSYGTFGFNCLIQIGCQNVRFILRGATQPLF